MNTYFRFFVGDVLPSQRGKPREFPLGFPQTTIQCLQRDRGILKSLARLIAWGKYDEAIALIHKEKSVIQIFSDANPSVLATKADYMLKDRCQGSVFEMLNPGDTIQLADGRFVLDEDLDPIDPN